MTPAIEALRRARVPFVERAYAYVDHGGTGEAARQLGRDEHQIVKTLVMVDDRGDELIVLMHGDRSVSTKNLARAIGAKTVAPATPVQAQRATGYQVGGISPFGTRKRLRVFAERSLFGLPAILINGGRRGCLVEIDPAVLAAQAGAVAVDCALAP